MTSAMSGDDLDDALVRDGAEDVRGRQVTVGAKVRIQCGDTWEFVPAASYPMPHCSFLPLRSASYFAALPAKIGPICASCNEHWVEIAIEDCRAERYERQCQQCASPKL
jgi:hypothetical protein